MPSIFSSELHDVLSLQKLKSVVCSATLLASILLSSGCASNRPQDFAGSKTRFELIRFFTGHCRSWGVFENSSGKPQRYFTCNSYGQRDTAGNLTLTQHFLFCDGKAQLRVWQIHQVDSTHLEATANDIIGVARGVGFGNAVALEYTITLDRHNPMATVHIRQWIYQLEGMDSVMTRLVITKLDLTVVEVSEVIHHVSSGSRY
jgi:Protein of unknown function (DUF3833)